MSILLRWKEIRKTYLEQFNGTRWAHSMRFGYLIGLAELSKFQKEYGKDD